MSEEIQKKLLEYLSALENALQQGKDLAIEQAPEVAREIVDFGLASHLMWASYSFILFGIGAYVFCRLWRWMIAEEALDVCPILMVPVFVILAAGFSTLSNLESCAKAYFAPRLYVIDHLRSEVKK